MVNKIKDIFTQSTELYLKKQEHTYLKEHSQFFTPDDIALKMVSTLDVERYKNKETLYILEPAAGFGILIYHLLNQVLPDSQIKKVYIDIYELDEVICTQLKENISFLCKSLKSSNNIDIHYRTFNINFLDKAVSRKYDIILTNPPYKKLRKTDPMTIKYKEYINGQPNLYTLFILACLKVLSDFGQLIVLSPRNFLTGFYSKKIRSYILDKFNIIHLHTFSSKSIFKDISQEVIISSFVRKYSEPASLVKVSYNEDFSTEIPIDKLIYSKLDNSILIPRSKEDLSLINNFYFTNTLSSLGLKAYVGPVVQFRQLDFLSKEIGVEGFVPFLTTKNIKKDNIIEYPLKDAVLTYQSISTSSSHINPIKNSIILKKIVSKSSKTINTYAVVLDDTSFNSKYVGFDNSLIFISSIDNNSEISIEVCYGLYCFLSTNYFKSILSLITGNHTINIRDIEEILFPDKKILASLGNKIIINNNFTSEYCNKIFTDVLKSLMNEKGDKNATT